MIEDIRKQMSDWLQSVACLPDNVLEGKWLWQGYDEGVRFAFFRILEEMRELSSDPAIFKPVFSDSSNEVYTYLEQFQQVFWNLKAEVAGLKEDFTHQQPAANDWSIRQTLEHILEVEWTFFGVIRYGFHFSGESARAPSGKMPQTFIDQHFDEDGQFPHGNFECSTAELFAFYEDRHADVLQGLLKLKDVELEKTVTFWEPQAMPTRFRLVRFESHLRQHLIQIQKTSFQITGQYPELRILAVNCAQIFARIDWGLQFPSSVDQAALQDRWANKVLPYLQVVTNLSA